MIHVFNKNQRALAAHEEYFSLLTHRPNVVLLGDNEGDAAMGHGVQDPEAMIKIGFLYHHVRTYLPYLSLIIKFNILNSFIKFKFILSCFGKLICHTVYYF